MEDFRKLGSQFIDKARSLVGDDDIVQKLEGFFSLYDKSIDELKTTIEKGKCMEEFQ